MPKLDRTGPLGQGPMTGLGQGNCNPNQGQEEDQRLLGRMFFRNRRRSPRGRGLGRGTPRGLGRRRR